MPSRGMVVAGVATELAAMQKVEHVSGVASELYHEGRNGTPLRAAMPCADVDGR